MAPSRFSINQNVTPGGLGNITPRTSEAPRSDTLIAQPVEETPAPQGTPAATPTPAAPAPTVEDPGAVFDRTADIIRQRMEAVKPEDEATRRRRERRERTDGIVAGVSDLARSLVNLFATHNYAPNGYTPANSASARWQARVDKAKAERDAADRQYLELALHGARMRGAAADARGRAADREAARIAAANAEHRAEAAERRADAEAARRAAAAPTAADLETARRIAAANADKAEAEAEAARTAASYAERHQRAAIAEARARAAAANRQPEYVVRDNEGNARRFYEIDAARNYAATYGYHFALPDDVTTETRTAPDPYGSGTNITTTTTTNRRRGYTPQAYINSDGNTGLPNIGWNE